MHSAYLSLNPVNPSSTTRNEIQRKSRIHHHIWRTPLKWKPFFYSSNGYRVSKFTSYSSVTDLDLYELLGIESSCDQAQIKLAYRALQKRCHPDIAGSSGHDMAIILNDAYAVLSDPSSRMAYDKEHEKFADLRGYTGKPLYSVWLGSENEKRAVFVDEVKCVGCLKCALFAEKTFAVESVYGRARVVSQWADPEDKIQAAIDTCPVDCISMVERSNLAALEFLMSKKPRGRVRVGGGNTVGVRSSNIFDDLDKFQARYAKNSSKNSKEADIQREARASAIQTIRSITNWIYWQVPVGEQATLQRYHFDPLEKKSTEPSIERLRDVAEARKQAKTTQQRFLGAPSDYANDAEYWTPSKRALSKSKIDDSDSKEPSQISSSIQEKDSFEQSFSYQKRKTESHPFLSFVPIVLASTAGIIVRLQLGEGTSGGLEEHIAGSLVRDVVNSNWLQVILAGVTWYLIGMYVAELVEVVQNKLEDYKN